MKKAFFAITVILLLAFAGQAWAMSLDEFVAGKRFMVTIRRAEVEITPWADKGVEKWTIPIQTPPEFGDAAARSPFSFFRAGNDNWYWTIVYYNARKSHNNFGIQYASLKYQINPIFEAGIKEGGKTKFLFRFAILKGKGTTLEKCYETPKGQEFVLLAPILVYVGPKTDKPMTGPKIVTVDAFKECGLRFKVYRDQDWVSRDVIALGSFDFSRDEMKEFLRDLLENTADEGFRQTIREILGTSSPTPETQGRDADGDGYYTRNADPKKVDCDDSDKSIHPGAQELCTDNKDNDCDGQINEGCSAERVDKDGDGYPAGEDCDDTDPLIYPGASERCGNGKDDDCDGIKEENCGSGPIPPDQRKDSDADQYYTSDTDPKKVDCDDSDKSIHPGAQELCTDNKDNDCDGQINEGCPSTVEEPSAKTFQLNFYFAEDVKSGDTISDFEYLRREIVDTWVCTDDNLLSFSLDEVRNFIYVTHFKDFFQMVDTTAWDSSSPKWFDSSHSAVVKCTVTELYKGKVVGGKKMSYVVQCDNVKLDHDYVWVLKYKKNCANAAAPDISVTFSRLHFSETGKFVRGWK